MRGHLQQVIQGQVRQAVVATNGAAIMGRAGGFGEGPGHILGAMPGQYNVQIGRLIEKGDRDAGKLILRDDPGLMHAGRL